MKELDVRGLACPEPIVRAKRALVDEKEGAVLLRVDSKVTRDNLEKFARSKGFSYTENRVGDEWEITITAGEKSTTESVVEAQVTFRNPPVVLCTRETFGTQNGELGTILIRAFFKTMLDLDTKPSAVLFVNDGVKLPCFDDQIIDYLKRLERLDVDIVSCGTCLDYLGLLEKLNVGRVGNMYDIASALLDAGHVVEP